ncbi:MAG: nuclear transport factor 2 family protein [Acidimicrobiia bacterium]
MDADVRRLIDESDVRRVMVDYARGVDTRNWELVRSIFTADAFVAGTRSQAPVDPYLEGLAPGVESFGTTMHVIGNHLIEVDGDSAFTETYLVARHFGDPAGTHDKLTMGVIYRDQLRRESDGRWRIHRRDVEQKWSRSS